MAETTNNQTARSRMLDAIRRNLATSRQFDRAHAEHQPHVQKTSILAQETMFLENAPLAAAPVQPLFADSLAERFQDALKSIGGSCTIVSDERAAAETLKQIIETANAKRIAVSNSVLVKKVVQLFETNAETLENASAAELFECDLGITGAQWAIAETGTLVLEAERENHRLASLVPPVHVCLINADCIRQTLGEILSLVNPISVDELSRTITFITGPSRTSDIELTLAIGVHGPGELHVIIVEK